MPEQHSEKFLLSIDIETKMSKAAQQVDNFQKSLMKLAKEPKKLQSAEKKAFGAMTKDVINSKKQIDKIKKSLQMAGKEVLTGGLTGVRARKAMKEMEKSFDDVEDASESLKKTLIDHRKAVFKAQSALRKAGTDDEKNSAKDALKLAKDAAKKEVEFSRTAHKAKLTMLREQMDKSKVGGVLKSHSGKLASKQKDQASKVQQTQKPFFDRMKSFALGLATGAAAINTALGEGGKELAIAAKGFGDALASKSVTGSIESAGELAGQAIEKGFKFGAGVANRTIAKAGAGASGLGGKALGKSESMWQKGGAANKAGAIGMGGVGAALKAVGGLAKSMGPLLNMVSKLGPLLATSASIFAGLVKIMLDAEAQAKQFNKDILESAGSADFLAQAGGDADKAYKNLDGTLDNMRNHAFDAVENMKWGITPKEHQAVMNTLNQEGVQLTSIVGDFKNAGDAATQSAAAVQDFSDLTHMSVTYSRNFGVSLAEIGSMQAELFTEMGSSLSTVSLQFSRMEKDAGESGIAANKFFNIIRGVSSDLALYNTRLEDTVSILKLLGKSMSPKNAQKFLQSMTKGMKDMSEEDRIKQTLVAGEGKQREIVSKDLARKEKLAQADLASAAGMRLEDVQAAVAQGGKAMEDVLAKVPENARGAFKEAMSEMKMDSNALKNGGVVGLSEASANLSAAGSFASKKAALQRFGGNKKLSEMTGVQGFAARKVTGTSLEEFRGMAKMEAAIDDQKKVMIEALKAVQNGGGTKEQKEMANRLEALNLTTEKSVNDAGDADIIAGMARTDADALAASQEQTNWAEKQAGLTSSISDKMDAIIDGIFEFLYVGLKDIISDLNEFINLVASKFGKERPEKEARNAIRAGKTDKNGRVSDVMQRALATEGPGDAKSKLISAIAPMLGNGMNKATKGQVDDDVRSVMGYGFKGDDSRSAGVVNMGDTKIDQKKKDAFNQALKNDPNSGAYVAMKTAGFDAEDMKAFLSKSVWGMTPAELGKIVPNLQTVQLGGSSMNTPTSPQAAAGQKAAAPGTQGAGAAMGAGADRIPPAVAHALANPSTSNPGNLLAGGGPGGSTPGAAVPVTQSDADLKQSAELIKGNGALYDALRSQGIKIDKSFMMNEYQKSTKDAVLDAAREALMEFALYTAKNPNDVLNKMGGLGGRSADLAKTFADNPANGQFLGKNAAGGVVTGIANGQAVVASPGEGLASVGRGETIVPAKGGRSGGDTFQINVNGLGGNDLARFLEGKINEGIYEYKRRERNR